ncbi:MAG: uroporphyrinogen-III synthase [Rhodobacteraceae bacterium]|nr:uroporphyrinogen-III synthase [Paracoccaceae bacterium]
MIEIEPIAANVDFLGVSHLLFTSVNGVKQLAVRSRERDIPALCVGKNTALAAKAAGFETQEADGTANDLLRLVLEQRPQKAGKFLHIGGEELSVDLAKLLSSVGVAADRLVLYRQKPVTMTPRAIEILANYPVVAPVFSENGAKVLLQQIENKRIKDLTVVCISAAVAKVFRFASVEVVTSARPPNREKMVQALLPLL